MFRSDVLVLGDGVLAIIGAILKVLFPKKTVVTILHGLDITYPLPFYQGFWIHGLLLSLILIICTFLF